MRFFRILALVGWAWVAGCSSSGEGGGGSSDGPGAPDPTPGGSPVSGADPARAIVEADIIQLDGERLYAMSANGTLSVIDVTPGHLALVGQTALAGRPFEMYRRGGYLVTMANGARGADGAHLASGTYADKSGGALVSVLDIHDPQHIGVLGELTVPGEIADSRIVGDVLYLASYENSGCYQCSPVPRTLVSSFDISDPTAMTPVDEASFASNAPDSYNLAWGTHWTRSIVAVGSRLYVGGHADVDPASYFSSSGPDEGIVDVLDISDPKGHFAKGAHLTVAGAILSRWQLDEHDGVLRVVSQRGAGRTGNGIGMPRVDTFRIDSSQAFVPLGKANLKLPRQEGLRTVRFDGARAYAITYNQTDPLFTIDLTNPALPAQRGELFMTGFMYYLEPHGDRLIGLGIDRADPGGSLNVSLFDVADLAKPKMLKRSAFGTPHVWEDYQILNGEVAEDQDRIQKAFRVLEDGLVVVPFTSLSDPTCANVGGGVEVIDWSGDTLVHRALLPLPGRPRRAFEHEGTLLAVSDSNVRAFGLMSKSLGALNADLAIGGCQAPSPGNVGNYPKLYGASYARYGYRNP